jgi:hypothetical protein
MPVRVVRFTDVDPERIESIKARIEESDGPPEGVVSTGVEFLHDPDQRTAVVVQRFASEEDMTTSEQALEAMDSGDTPGTRASVDRWNPLAYPAQP